MKMLIASDIHGSAYWCRKLTEAWDRENPGPDILKDADKALLQMKQNGKLGCRIYGE